MGPLKAHIGQDFQLVVQ